MNGFSGFGNSPLTKKAGPEPNTKEIDKLMNVDPFSIDEQAYQNAQNDYNTSNPTKAQIAASKAKIKKEGE
jgi:hypothetical protein